MDETVPTWGDLFYGISPYAWGYTGIAVALGFSIIGAAWVSSLTAGHLPHWLQSGRVFSEDSENQIQELGLSYLL